MDLINSGMRDYGLEGADGDKIAEFDLKET